MRGKKLRLTIRTKLLGGFMVLVVLLVAVFGVAYTGLNDMADKKDEIVKQHQVAKELELLDYNSITQFFMVRDATANIGSPLAKFYLENAETYGNALYANVETLHNLLPADQSVILDEYRAFQEQAVIEASNPEGVNMLALAETNKKMAVGKDALKTNAAAAMVAAQKSANDSKNSATLITLAMASIAAILAMSIGFVLSRSISGSARKMVDAANRIADEDLTNLSKTAAAMAEGDMRQFVNINTQQISVKSSDEMGELAQAFNKMIAKLHNTGESFTLMTENMRQLIGKVAQNTDQLNTASDHLSISADQVGAATQQVAATSQQIARGTQDQAANSLETARAVEQLTEVVNQIARGSQEQSSGIQKAITAISEVSAGANTASQSAAAASELSKKAATAAKNGADRATETVEGMKRIRASVETVSQKVSTLGQQSEEIGKIVAVIEDIAAQTNLLALNAAIEAARAGEHGRGFAVVSDEVRKLAERTAGATKEIANLIGNVQKGVGEAVEAMKQGSDEVNGGYKLTTQAGESLDEILKTSVEVSQQIEQISSATRKMAESANQMVQVIDSVGSVTEENTAATEEMSSSAEQVARAVDTIANVAEQNSADVEKVSASAEETSAQMQEVVASSQSLKLMAQELQMAISIFKVNGNGSHHEESTEEELLIDKTVFSVN